MALVIYLLFFDILFSRHNRKITVISLSFSPSGLGLAVRATFHGRTFQMLFSALNRPLPIIRLAFQMRLFFYLYKLRNQMWLRFRGREAGRTATTVRCGRAGGVCGV